MLEFNIRNQEISRIDNFSPAEKSVEYLIAKFNFKTEDWNEAIKRAIFRNVKSKVEKDAMIEDDSCVVPWEVLEGSGDIEVSVHGVINTKDITTDVAVFNLNRTLQGGSATQEPSPTVYAQMVEMVKDAKEVAQSVRTDADNGKFNGPQGDPGEDGKSAYQYAVEGGFKGTEQEFIDSMGKAGQVDLTGYVTKEQHEAELLKTMVKVTTDKAPHHHITDSANMKVVDFGMEGKTEQKTTEGTNLFDEIVREADGLYQLDGSWDANVKYDTYYLYKEKDSNQYMFSHNIGGIRTFWDADGNYLSSISVSEYSLPMAFPEGAVLCKFAMNKQWRGGSEQIALGTTLPPYEPFTNGPSPNQDFEQKIENAGVYNEETGRYEHKGCVGNKNFFDLDYVKNMDNWIVQDGGGGYRSLPLPFLQVGHTYTIGMSENNMYKGYKTEYNGRFAAYVSTTPYKASGIALGNTGTTAFKDTKKQITITEDSLYYLNMFARYTSSFEDDLNIVFDELLKDFQIEYDSSKTDYTPHASQPFTLTSPVPLTKWDYLTKRDGVWGWSVWSNNKQMSSSDGWSEFFSDRTPEGIYTYQSSINDKANGFTSSETANVYCTTYKATNKAYAEKAVKNTMSGISSGTRVFFSTDIPTLDEWKAHIDENPLDVWYQTAEEVAFHPLPDEEQTLLNNLETYYGVTNMYNDQGCPMWFTYCADQELHWNQKLLQIQQAII